MAKCPFAEWRPITGSSGSYNGGPFKIVHHTTEGSTAQGAFAAFKTGRSDPHFTVDSQTIYQHIDTSGAARALRNPPGGVETNRDSAIQIEVVGFAGRPKSRATLLNLAKLCRWIEKTHNIPRDWPNGPPKPHRNGQDPGGHNRNAANWDSKAGHYGHSHVPENTHWDPAYTAAELSLIMGTEFESGQAMISANLAETFAAIPETEEDLDGLESTMPDHAVVEDDAADAVGTPSTITAGAAARPSAPTVPANPHTPVRNFSTEAVEESEELAEPGSLGDAGDAPLPVDDGAEVVQVFRRELAAPAEVQWNVPDTADALDAGIASFGLPRTIQETVHGPDNRIQITATAKYPWRVNASLLITGRDNSRWIGTGWFIGPRTLVTAGHCVYIKNSGIPERDGWVKNIQVMPGRDGTTLPFGSVTATQFWSVTGWTAAGDENYDYAAIILPVDLGSRVGFLGFGVLNDARLRQAKANIAGYPSDKPQGTLWYDKNGIASVNPTKVYYDIDTVGGQSGAAVYVIQGEERTAVAVHAYGGATSNSGTRITRPVYDNLMRWKV